MFLLVGNKPPRAADSDSHDCLDSGLLRITLLSLEDLASRGYVAVAFDAPDRSLDGARQVEITRHSINTLFDVYLKGEPASELLLSMPSPALVRDDGSNQQEIGRRETIS